jgi:hypothetical protein
MRSFFGLMATSVVVWFGLSIGAAMAEGLDEQATNPGDYFTDLNSLYASMIPKRSNQADSIIEGFNSVHDIKSVNSHNNKFKAPLTDKINFTSDPFNEFVVLVSNLDITTTPALNLNPNPLYTNSDKNNLISTANPMPEPETHSMLLIGIGLVGFSIRRRRFIG